MERPRLARGRKPGNAKRWQERLAMAKYLAAAFTGCAGWPPCRGPVQPDAKRAHDHRHRYLADSSFGSRDVGAWGASLGLVCVLRPVRWTGWPHDIVLNLHPLAVLTWWFGDEKWLHLWDSNRHVYGHLAVLVAMFLLTVLSATASWRRVSWLGQRPRARSKCWPDAGGHGPGAIVQRRGGAVDVPR